jgi:DNA end-binding protein Ku
MRAIWSGEIAFALVSIPVKLYAATRDLTPQFTTLHQECGSKIQMVRRCPTCARDVAWGELAKGYEVSAGKYAVFTKEELAKLDGEEAGGSIEVVEFVEPSAVDLAFIDKSYWVGPSGKNARGFSLLRQALLDAGRVALVKTRLRTRTRLALLRPRGQLFGLEMMRYADEIVEAASLDVPEVKTTTPRELALAKELVETLSAPFDPEKHPDQYRAAIEHAVDEKAGTEVTAPAGAVAADREGGKVIDLADLLARSLAKAEPGPAAKKRAPVAEPHAKPGPKKASSKDSKKREAG